MFPVLACAGLACAALACSQPTPEESSDGSARTIEVFGPWVGVSADRFEASIVSFEQDTGIDVRYIGSADFANELRRRVNDARAPDVAIVPQPGVIADLDARGQVVPLGDAVVNEMTSTLDDAVRQLGAIDGALLAVPYRVNIKSLVWYSPPQWEAMGWSIPSSYPELLTLTRRIAGEGIAPWCFGIGAFGATGWVVTDWIEETVLREAGETGYDAWVDGDLAFTDPEIVHAFETVDALLLQRGHVLGNTAGIVRTSVDEAILPLLEEPPRCAMHRNGTFTQDWLPSGTPIGPDEALDVFILPPEVSGTAPPLLAGVDLAIAMSEQDHAQDFLQFLATTESGDAWAEAGGYLGGREGEQHAAGSIEARLAEAVGDAPMIRVDASDQMTPEFGSGTFWLLAAEWVSGLRSTDAVTVELESARAPAEG